MSLPLISRVLKKDAVENFTSIVITFMEEGIYGNPHAAILKAPPLRSD